VTSSITKKPCPEQTLTVPWVDIRHDAQDGLLAVSVRIGLPSLQPMMAAEVEPWAGPKGRHDAPRQAVRHGTEVGSVFFGDRKISVPHPRVRAADGGETPSSSHAAKSINNGIGSTICRNRPKIGSASADGKRIKNRMRIRPHRPSKRWQKSENGTIPARPGASEKGWRRPSPCIV